jgi:RHS repeat-associated protein
VTNGYDADGFLQKSIALEAQATNTFTFSNGELASRTTPLGLTLNYSHDALGRLTRIAFPDGSTISNWFDRLDLRGRKDRLGGWTYATYNNMGQATAIVSPNNRTTSYGYCDCGALNSVTDPGNNTTTFLRNYLGQVTNVISAQGTTVIERDTLGQPVHVTSSYGLDLTYAHNLQGLVTAVNNSAGTAVSVIYDADDRPSIVTDAQGTSITNSFDGLGRVLSRWSAFGRFEYNVYSAQGLFQHYDALENLTSYGYDGAGRLTSVTNANLEVTRVGLDPEGNMLSLTDGRTNTKSWSYDIYSRQIAERNANGLQVKTRGYDANGRLTSQWTVVKGTTTFAYDADGNLLTISSPHSTISYTYDALNRLATMSDGAGNSSFTYTNFGAFRSALASEDGPWTGDTVSYGYSGPNLTSLAVGSWSQTITRDGALRPHSITSPAGTFTYGYNGAGRRLASLQFPGGTTTFTYDAIGEPKTIQVKNSAQTLLDYHGYDYDLDGLVTNVTRLNSVNAAYGYDPIGQLVTAQGFESSGALRKNENLGYAYDASGNLAFRTNNTLLQSFTCDALNQLASVTRAGPLTVVGSVTGAVTRLCVNGTNAQIYSDATFATANGLTLNDGNNLFVAAGSNAVGELVVSTVTRTRLPMSIGFLYDLNGNLVSDGLKSYAYDDADQLTNITVTGQWKTEFVYDGLGRRRITRDYTYLPSSNSYLLTNEVHYIYDGMTVAQERDTNNVAQVTYTRGLDLSGAFQGAGGIGGLLARSEGSSHAFYHADSDGNISSLTDSSGNVAARYLYDPFGNLLGKWGALADANRYRFSSKEAHGPSGMYYYGFRFYDPNLQRWLNQDPLGEDAGANLHQFALNAPLNWLDPFGLESITACGMLADELGETDLHREGRRERDNFVKGAKVVVTLLPQDAFSVVATGESLSGEKAGTGERIFTGATALSGPAASLLSKLKWLFRCRKAVRLTGEALEKVRREFEAMKPKAWIHEAARHPKKYTPEQLARMTKGRAPVGNDGFPMEIHHKQPLTNGGANSFDNFEFLTRTEHRLGEKFKENHPDL